MQKFTLLIIAFFCVGLISAQTVYENYQDGRIHFKLKDRVSVRTFTKNDKVDLDKVPLLKNALSEFKTRSLTRPYFGYADHIDRVFLYEFGDYYNVDKIIRSLEDLDMVEFAVKLPVFTVAFTPNDYANSASYLNQINAKAAWDYSKGDPNVIVAVIDNAILKGHPELSSQLWVNSGEIAGNGKDDDGNGYVDDINGWDFGDSDPDMNPPTNASDVFWSHGTYVSGVASAATNNGQFGASIGFNTKLMVIKGAKDSEPPRNPSNPFGGILYAARNGAKVINMSFGTDVDDPIVKSFIEEAYNRGAVLIAAAGNLNSQAKQYPAAYPEVIGVAAVSSTDAKHSSSNYGTWVEVSAPGVNIYTTSAFNPGSTVQSGTSVAAPVVAGLAGLIISHNPGLTNKQVMDCILNSATNIDAKNPAYSGLLGSGRIDAAAALKCADDQILSLDAGITSVIAPLGSSCEGTYTPKVILRNLGTTVLTKVDIKYSISGGAEKTYSWTGNLAWLAQKEVTLPQISVSIDGDHTFEAYTAKPNGGTDLNTANDKSTSSFTKSFSVAKYPYFNDFESQINGWGHNSIELIPNGNPNPNPMDLWQWGVPQGTFLNGAKSGSKAWGTNLKGKYDHSNRAFLTTPCFDFSFINEPWVEFWMKFDIEGDWDAMFFDYSTDNGKTWKKLGTANDLNWYNNGKKGDNNTVGIHLNGAQWTNTAGDVPVNWRRYQHDLSILKGQASVAFRFHLVSDDFTYKEGALVDDFKVYDKNPNTSVDELRQDVLSIFPNPAKDKLMINGLVSGRKYDVTLYDILGNELESLSLVSENNVFDLKSYAPGIYLLGIRNGQGEEFTRRIIISE